MDLRKFDPRSVTDFTESEEFREIDGVAEY